MYIAIVSIIVAIVAIWLAYGLGKSHSARRQAERENVERERDAEIAAQPYIDDPAAAMRKLRR